MKKVLLPLICFSLLLMLCGCGHEHVWKGATCTEPTTCTKCGETKGDPLGHKWEEASCEEPKHCIRCGITEGESLGGHKWEEATCTEPKTCSVCKKTEGDPLGHSVDSWSTVKKPTCTEKGTEEGLCSTCEQTVSRDIDLVDHTPGDWEVKVEATEGSSGTRVIKCTVCGKELQSESYTLTPEEIKAQYISQCQSIAYDNLARTPDDYKGTKVKMSGYVLQVASEATSSYEYSAYRVATRGRYDNVVYLRVDNYGTGRRILEDDKISFYGESDGLMSYKTVMGATMTIPQITAKYVD